MTPPALTARDLMARGHSRRTAYRMLARAAAAAPEAVVLADSTAPQQRRRKVRALALDATAPT